MNAIDCLVHPQIGTEAFPGVVLEAFAAGDHGTLVEPEAPHQLAAALVHWAAQSRFEMAQRQQMPRQIKDRSSLPVVAQRAKELYEHLITPESVTELIRC
jgi:glycogen synthase